MQLQDILFSQGFGTRRVCAGLVQQGHVQVALPRDGAALGGPDDGSGTLPGDATGLAPGTAPPWQACTDALADFPPEGLRFRVQGVEWPYHAQAYLMLHKPAGTECSQKPSAHPSIYTLLPSPLRMRPQKSAVQGVQAVGRLDQDTTGLLLLSDDGHFIHRMASPRHHVPKVYEVGTEQPVTEAQVRKLLQGVVLEREPQPVRAAACHATGSHTLQLTLTEGKFHQVKRMVASAGNRVATLHRSRIGDLVLPADLAPGRWRWLSEAELLAAQRVTPKA